MTLFGFVGCVALVISLEKGLGLVGYQSLEPMHGRSLRICWDKRFGLVEYHVLKVSQHLKIV